MIDPISEAIAGAARATGDKVIEAYIKGENDHEEWIQQVIEVAAEAEAAAEYYGETRFYSEYNLIEDKLEQKGLQAQKLGVIGEMHDYNQKEVKAVKELADICGKIGKADTKAVVELDSLLNEDLPKCVKKIFAFPDA